MLSLTHLGACRILDGHSGMLSHTSLLQINSNIRHSTAVRGTTRLNLGPYMLLLHPPREAILYFWALPLKKVEVKRAIILVDLASQM